MAKQGLYCVPCVLFSTTTSKICSFGELVSPPLNNYKKLLDDSGYIAVHLESDYHQTNMAKAEHFLHTYIRNNLMYLLK